MEEGAMVQTTYGAVHRCGWRSAKARYRSIDGAVSKHGRRSVEARLSHGAGALRSCSLLILFLS